jgi:hypothetical protein
VFTVYLYSTVSDRGGTTEYTQSGNGSGVHSIMMGKLAQPGEGGGCTPTPPFTLFTITYKVAVYAPAERADTLTLFYYFISTPICTLWEVQHSVLCTKT